jgi:hypothetical protein
MASDTPPKTPSKLTREELYRRVWETPLQHLAAREFLAVLEELPATTGEFGGRTQADGYSGPQ